jgi:hypothetical protein
MKEKSSFERVAMTDTTITDGWSGKGQAKTAFNEPPSFGYLGVLGGYVPSLAGI